MKQSQYYNKLVSMECCLFIEDVIPIDFMDNIIDNFYEIFRKINKNLILFEEIE